MPSRFALRLAAAAVLVVPAFAARPADSPLADEARRHLDARVYQLGLDRDHGFSPKSVFEEPTGEAHIRMHQLYKGVRVFEGESVVHMRGGAVTDRTDALVRGLNLNVVPTLAHGEALAVAHQSLAPKGAYAHAPTSELVVATLTRDIETPRGTRTLSRPALAYHIHTELENGAEETRHTDFLVDAHTGAILESWSTLHTISGTGNSQFSGTVAINTTANGATYDLRDTTRGMNYATYNLNHATTGTGTLYNDADNTWGDGANYVAGGSTTTANGQTAAVDAHYGVGLTYDFYKNVLSRNGIDGNNGATYSRVHYSSAYDNAFWSDSCFCMTYGDGSSFKSLESIDVAGHEMSHGVMARTANLTYRGESGGLNEANSDIFGSMVEFMAHGGGTNTVPNYTSITGTIQVNYGSVPAANYLIGEQLATNAFNKPLRYMYKPSLDGSSPDAWSKTLGRLDVHYSSGVANHFFFLLAHGSQIDAFSGNLQSPLANGVTSIAGIGNDLAARIWYKAITAYMTSSTNYAGARVATLNACTALGYPSGSSVYTTVNNAWLAVNVK
ncbi:M4 family metallopeptidase [Geothrix sp.]|jgi:Zn-dependent metalloprotease|uniref:M4 family metallopeptidase n=1 Tax=Geothrix sp. TaxID=1962974 RepID=UPI0025C70379|nr:M4 family metallopeptidase [Geothrix sp.]